MLCLELPCLVQEYSRSASHTCSMWGADSVHVMELLSDYISGEPTSKAVHYINSSYVEQFLCSTIPRRRRNREGTERREKKPYRTSPESRRGNYLAEGKSKYPFPVGFETTQVVCYQQKWPV